MANLQKLVILRRSHRVFVDENFTEIENTKEDLAEFETILESIEEKVDINKTLDENILSQTLVDGVEEEMAHTLRYNLKFEIALRYLRDFERKQKQSTTNQHTRVDKAGTSYQHSDHQYQPRGQISTSGELNTNASSFDPLFHDNLWQSFWDAFESSVHINNGLTEEQKFTYLQSQLEGAAARTIDGFALTNDNYARAISLLREGFCQPQKTTHTTMQALIQLPAPCNTLSSLRM